MAKLEPPKKDVNKNTSVTVNEAKPKKSIEQTPPDAIKPLQLKIPESSKNEFKAYAAMRGIHMNDLFLQIFNEYKESHSK